MKQVLAVARRRQPGQVLVEGPRAVREAELAGREIELLVLREGETIEVAPRRVVTVAAQVFNGMTQTETPQGVMAVVRASYCSLDVALALARDARWPLVVLDGVQDPGNVGTIVRTAAAAGAPAVVSMPGTADALAPKAVRASAGNVFRLAVAKARWPELADLSGYGTDAGATRSIYDAEIESADLVVFGNEAHGLSAAHLEPISIPITTGVESLNVAAAAAVFLFEIRRRRGR